MLSIGFLSGARNAQLSDPKLPEYQFSVEDVDGLVAELFRLSDVNPGFFRSTLVQEHASKYFTFRNRNPLAVDLPNKPFEPTR